MLIESVIIDGAERLVQKPKTQTENLEVLEVLMHTLDVWGYKINKWNLPPEFPDFGNIKYTADLVSVREERKPWIVMKDAPELKRIEITAKL